MMNRTLTGAMATVALLGAQAAWAATAPSPPFAPAAGQAGSTAIFKDDALFAGWASAYQDYLPGGNVDAMWQVPGRALGEAVGDAFDIVALGRGGQITLTFDTPIGNGSGWDFAVFENSFSDTFLELAYVEVSSNGSDFVRFDNYSYTPGPVGAFGNVVPEAITGYAGKYRQGWGTPFDLQELAGNGLLDIDLITHVRLIDIVGDGSRLDSNGNVIYDPYPTTGSAGFDLDAVGVIHQAVVPLPAAGLLFAPVLLGIGLVARRELTTRPQRPNTQS